MVEKCVNNVGVNVNTASLSLLKYVSGLTKSNIDKLIKYRDEHGKIKDRKEIKKLFSDKVYTQAVGFLRIMDEGILDSTSIHPESYDITLKLLDMLGLSLEDIGTSKMQNINIDVKEYAGKLGTDEYTLEDIIKDDSGSYDLIDVSSNKVIVPHDASDNGFTLSLYKSYVLYRRKVS